MSNKTPKQLETTKARGKFNDALFDSPDHWAEEKYDGERRTIHFMDGVARIIGYRGSAKDGLFLEKTEQAPQISHAGQIKTLEATVLDGEVYRPGLKSHDVTSIMNSAPEIAIAKQKERGLLNLYVFDCLFFHGDDVRGEPLTVRRKLMLDALKTWRNRNVFAADLATGDEARAMLQRIWESGGEGLVFKDKTAPYGVPRKWIKLKREETHDCVIMGFKEPKEVSFKKKTGEVSPTKYAQLGWIGSIVFGQYRDGVLTVRGSCSGVTDGLRAEMSANRDAWIGTVIEVKAIEQEPSGVFRSPQFVRPRPDKPAKDCVWTNVGKKKGRV